jgi:hypothetical protein
MARLPFLVEHGPIVWRGLAVIAAAVAIAVVRRARARRERRATARELAVRTAEVTAPVEGRATVRGTLRGGRAASVSLLHLRGPRPYYDERSPGLWLDCDGQRVELVGAIRVVRGTRAVSTRDRRSAVPDDELAVRSSPILHRLPALAVSVRDGDEVFATARLAPRPATEVRGYREATTAWTATPDGGEIELVAAAPVARAIPLGRMRSAALGVAGAALTLAALGTAGGVAMWWADTPGPRASHLVAGQPGELDPLSVAAATPGHRDGALAALQARFATRYERTPASFALWRRVARLRSGCGGELEARIAQGEIDGLAELAHRCDDDRAAGDAYQLLGLFREAAERDVELPTREQHLESLIAIGAWQRAGWWAGTLHYRASVRSPAPFACAEQWFRWLAGFTPASEARARVPQDDPACKVIAALLVPDSRRAGALADAALYREVERMADALAWANGTPNHIEAILPIGRVALHRAMFDPGDRTTIARALLSGPALDRADDPTDSPGARATQAWRSVRDMLWGDLPGARTLARTGPGEPAMAELAAQRYPVGSYSQALDVAFALRAAAPLPSLAPDHRRWPSVPPGPVTDPDVLWQRYETMYWGALLGRQTCDHPDLGPGGDLKTVTLRAASTGDGRALAELLARCRLDDAAAIEAVFAVWPRLRTGRDRLADVLRTIDLGPPATDPLAAIGRAAMHRDLARLIGDSGRAAAWQAVTERHLRAFSSYTALTALMVRELLRAADPDAR